MAADKNKLFIIPDFITTQDRECIHAYKQWLAIGYKIDNHPLRIAVCEHKSSGETREFDCKGPIGVMVKSARLWGSNEEGLLKVDANCRVIQAMKNEKAHYNALWSNKVYGKARGGDKTFLNLRSAEIIDLFGKYYTADEVRRIINDKYKFFIKSVELTEFYNKHKEKIERKRADYVLAGKETRLATDAGRMEILSKIAWEMELRFEKSKSLEVSKELRATLEQIRKEVKGEELRLTIDGKIDINATIQANQTLHVALQKLPINMIVIGLTAAKQGINPAWLIASLANSYYAKFNGFNKLEDKSEIQLPGKFIKAYNWEEIRMKHEENKIEEVEVIEVFEEAIEEPAIKEAEDNKQKMLDILRGLKEDPQV